MPRVVPSTAVAIIDKLFPWASFQLDTNVRSLNRTFQTQVATVIDSVERIPEELLILDPSQYENFLIAVSIVKSTMKVWEIRECALHVVSGVSNLNPISMIRQLLAKCPDESIIHASSSLKFIRQKNLRDSILLDISGANQALSNGEWKAATILGGAAIEALLLWKLRNRPQTEIKSAVSIFPTIFPKKTLSLEMWNLNQMAEVAMEIKLIKAETHTQVKLAKDFRNLIHPGKAIRTGQRCDRGTALTGVAALEAVIKDLTP